MILYDSQIKERGTYIHTNTKNESFIYIAKLLKTMGIQSHKFFLTIYDKDLMYVDPFLVTSRELKIKIANECRINFWYFLREIAKVNEVGGDGLASFKLDRFNLALFWCLFNNFDVFGVILRQVGKSTSLFTLIDYLLHLGTSKYQSAFISKDIPAIQEAVSRVKDMRDGLPKYLYHKQFKDGDNKEGVGYAALGNMLRTFVAQASISGARKIVRGLSVPLILNDEIAYCSKNWITLPSAMMATSRARTQAQAKGLLNAVCLTTTAGDPSTAEGKFAYKIKNECMHFSEKLYDCKDRAEAFSIIKTGSKRQMVYITYNHLQLGYTDEWLEDQKNRNGLTDKEADRDLRNIWTSDEGQDIFEPEDLIAIRDGIKDPKFTQINYGMIFKYYISEEELVSPEFLKRKLIFGGDVAENIGRDFSSTVMVDATTLEVICVAQTNTLNLTVYGRCIFDILVGFENAVWIPERNNTGAVLIDIVLDLMLTARMNPYKRIYNLEVQNAVRISDINEMTIQGTVKSKFGFHTGGGKNGSRSLLYGQVLKLMTKYGKHLIRDQILSEQLRDLEIRNGRIDHPMNGHDDEVVSWLLAGYLVFFGKNLSYYGIALNEVFKPKQTEEETNEQKTKITKQHYNTLMEEYYKLTESIELSKSEILKQAYRKRQSQIELLLEGVEFKDEVASRSHLKAAVVEQEHRQRRPFNAELLKRFIPK